MAKSVDDFAAEPMMYFSHDSNAAADIKCQRLIKRMGYAGYGRWWRLCEHMASVKGHSIPFVTDEDKLILGDILGFDAGNFDEFITIDETTGFIDGLLNIGLLTKNEKGELFNNRMMENSQYFGKQRYNGNKGGRPRKQSKTDQK